MIAKVQVVINKITVKEFAIGEILEMPTDSDATSQGSTQKVVKIDFSPNVVKIDFSPIENMQEKYTFNLDCDALMEELANDKRLIGWELTLSFILKGATTYPRLYKPALYKELAYIKNKLHQEDGARCVTRLLQMEGANANS